jgi:quercetin dioxygenase-like cupin family protein
MTVRSHAYAAALLALLGGAAFSSTAFAGTCPVDQTRPSARASGEMNPVGVTDNEIGIVKLDSEIRGLNDRRLRLRRLVVQPGGVVPWHSHADRPALITVVSGAVTEYRSTCAVGIEHKAGDVSEEAAGVSHWWKNNGKVPVVLLSADIKNDGAPADGDHM